MFSTIKRMVESGKYSHEYIDERIETFYLVGKLTRDEYLKLKEMIQGSV